MNDDGLIKDIAGLSKPATVLIEKISDGIGGYAKPYQIKRVAKAEAEAEIIKTLGKIKATELQQRAIHRFIGEEAKHQANMELITEKAIGYLEDDAKPEQMENDWISNFFDKCRLISDEEMQELWAKLLAGEANEPGKYSKRTVNCVASMDKRDATLFTNLCSFVLFMGKTPFCFINNVHDSIHTDKNINFNWLKHLETVGLIHVKNNIERPFFHQYPVERIRLVYFDTTIHVTLKKRKEIANINQEEQVRKVYELDFAYVHLTTIGEELAPIAGSEPIPEFVDYLIDVWTKKGYKVTRDRPLEEEKKT